MNVLIADDFKANRALLRAILSSEGFDVMEAADGAEALKLLEDHAFDLIISDILMPNVDGYRLCTEIRKNSRFDQVPFVFHTSTYTSPSDEVLAMSLGADAFLRKPVAARSMVDTVNQLLNAPRPPRRPVEPPTDMDLTAEYTQRLVAKLEEKNEELFARTLEARKNTDVLSTLILAAPVAIVSFDSDGIIRTWNRAAERIFGWAESEVLGRTPQEAGVELDHQGGSATDPLTGPISGVEMTGRRRDGSVVHVELSAASLHDGEGRVAGRMVVFADITERKKAEEALVNARADLETLSRRLLASGEAEMRRIARELHDEIGQSLTAVKLGIEAAKTATDPAVHSLRLDDAIAVIDHLLQAVRALSLDLRPASLDELGLVAALRAHVHSQAARSGLEMRFESDELPRSRIAEAEIACFRIAQEALTNIIRHAHAKSVLIGLRRHDDEVRLVVEDDGIGFEPAFVDPRAEGGANFGLLSMRERAQLVGGRFFCASSAGRGTRIEAAFPW